MITINEAETDYLEYLASRDRSQSTSATYAYGLKRFKTYLHRQHGMDGEEPVSRLTQRHADGFGIYLYRLKLAATTRSTYLVVLRNWFRYLGRHPELPEGSPVNPDLIELPKSVRKVPSPDERLTLMLSVSSEAAEPWREIIRLRDQAMLETLFSTQLRVSELASLNRNSIDWSQGIAVVTGKGRKTRTVFFSQRALQAVQAYLDARKDSYLPLFIHHDRAHNAPSRVRGGGVLSPLAGESQRGGSVRRGNADGDHMRLTRQSVERVVRKYARIAGVDATPHTFRHYGATELLRNGADIRTVQELLGHASIQTTQIYTHVSPRRLQAEWRRFHPAAEGGGGEEGR